MEKEVKNKSASVRAKLMNRDNRVLQYNKGYIIVVI